MAGSLNSLLWYSIVNGVPIQFGVGYGGARAAATLPMMGVVGYGGINARAELPTLTVSAKGHDSSGENQGVINLPPMELRAYAGANLGASLPQISLVIAATLTSVARADVALPAVVLSGTGKVGGLASALLTTPALTMSAFFGGGQAGALPSITAVSTGKLGGVASALATLPAVILVGTATRAANGRLDALLPALAFVPVGRMSASLYAIGLAASGHLVVTAAYEAYAINLNHVPRKGVEPNDEVTHYVGFPFSQILRYRGENYGVAANGLYLLGGATDAGAEIPWEVKTGTTDFDSAQNKTVEMAYFGGRMGAAATVSLHVGEAAPQVYSYTTPRGALAQNYRQPFGRGLKARYFALSASGSNELTLDSLTLNVATLARKV